MRDREFPRFPVPRTDACPSVIRLGYKFNQLLYRGVWIHFDSRLSQSIVNVAHEVNDFERSLQILDMICRLSVC